MREKLPRKKGAKIATIVLAVLVGIWISYFVVYGYLLPSGVLLFVEKGSFSTKELTKIDTLLRQHKIQYWLDEENRGVFVTWAQQQKAYELLLQDGWPDNRMMPENEILPRWFLLSWKDWKFILNPEN